MWICEYCSNNNEVKKFNQKDFVNHLRSYHLSKFNHNQNIKFQCNYGENGMCFDISNNQKLLSQFQNEKEYGQHLIKVHLKSVKNVEQNQFIISDSQTIENSRNYQNIVNPTNNSISKWNPYHSVVNLPAVLNDPNNRQLDVFSKTWGESFEKAELPQCPNLVAPKNELFKDYINQVRGSLMYREKMLKKINESKNLEGNSANSDQTLKLESVPKLFFQPDFSLNSKDIFSSVIPIFHNVFNSSPHLESSFILITNKKLPNSNGRLKNQKWLTDAAANRMNDKLSHYLDIVEINIAKQVSKKSNSFFEAVSTQDKVQEKLKSALTQISVVRSKLQTADEKLTKNHLHVLMLSQRKSNLQILLKQLQVVKTVHSTQAVIQTLLASNDFCGALDLIAGTQSIMQYEFFSSKSSQVSPILCLRHVHAQLVEMRKFVEKMVQQEYLNVISYQLRLENDLLNSNDDLAIDYQLVSNLLAIIRIILYSSSSECNVNEFVQRYFDEAMEVLKTVVKSRVLQAFSKSHQILDQSSMSASIDEGTHGTLADQVRALTFDQWMELMKFISSDMLQLLDKIRIGSFTMVETILTHVGETGIICDTQHVILPVQSEGNIINQLCTVTIAEIKALPVKIVDTMRQRIDKVIRARAKNLYFERILPTQMVQLNQFLQDFSDQIALRIDKEFSCSNFMISSSLHSYASRLATRFHNEHKEKLLLILDSDLWRAAEVPSQLQELAKHISNQPGLSLLDKNGVNSSDTQISHQFLQLDHSRFTVVAAALMLFQMIVEYCQCAIDLCKIPNISELLFSHLISLLETFNSRSCQLVLGAKARQLVELETISARNLALAARSLQLVLALTPRIILQFSDLTPIKQSLLSQLSAVEQMYHDHIENINNKLISLMEDRIRYNMATWSGKPPTPSSEIRTICQHLNKLHEAICNVYPPSCETELFLKIHNIFKTHFRARMKEINIVMDNGPQHGIVKVEWAFYMNQLTGFCGSKKYADKFSDIWK